jgi:hypothetical protein
MTVPAGKCPTCGEKILPSIGECLYCPPPGAAPDPAPAARPRPAAPVSPVPSPEPAPPPPAPVAVPEPVAPPPAPPPAAPVAEQAAPPPAAQAPADAPPPAAPSAARPPGDSAFGLLLFEAEECLARGNAEKAVVHASRAVRERPESLTARSLWERARRELLRGRRRERLEARLRQAQDLYEGSDFAASSKIVTTALKLIPDHPLALDLFGRLKERRLRAATAEAEAERELDRLAQAEAERALEAARTALIARWDSRALLSIRRGLRQAPDHPELLALHRDVQSTLEAQHARNVGRRVRQAQVRSGLDLLARGRFEESLKVLRGLLREDPDYAPAQAAVQEVRRAWLARGPAASPPAHATATSTPAPAPAVAAAPAARPRATPPAGTTAPAAAVPPRDVPLTGSWHSQAPPRPASSRPATGPRPAVASAAIPPEILLPRARKAGPWPWIAFGAGSLVAGLLLVRGQGGGGPGTPPPTTVAPARQPPATAAAAPTPEPVDTTGPLAAIPPELRDAIVATVTAYGRALEALDAEALARARPDLAAPAREALLAPLKDAVNVATDLRVLDVLVEGDRATVPVLHTDVVVGGRGTRPPVEEVLQFERRDGIWTLRTAR